MPAECPEFMIVTYGRRPASPVPPDTGPSRPPGRSRHSHAVGTMAIAPAIAHAEPHGYRMECLGYVGSGILSPITDVAQRTGGLISFYDTYDNHQVGQLDAVKMHQQTGPHTALQESYEECSANVYCQIGIAAVDAFILSMVKALYLLFKALL
jgi:hypothetical protein